MSDKKIVLIRRGLRANMPKSAPLGELLYCKDTNDLYIGTGNNVSQIAKGDAVYDGGDFLDMPKEFPNLADGGSFNE